MKIALISFEVPWSFMGGVEIHTWELAKAFSKKGHDVKIFTSWNRDLDKTFEKREGVGIHYVPIPKNFQKLKEEDYLHHKRFTRFFFKRYLKKKVPDVDVIHSQNYDGSSVANFDGAKIATIHTSVPQGYIQGKLPLPRGLPQRILISADYLSSLYFHSKIDKTIVVSDKVANDLNRWYGVNPKVIPNGALEAEKIEKSMAKEHLDINFERTILYFGRMAEVKRPDKLLKVLKDPQLSDVGILYGGKGSYLENVKKKVREKNLEDRVKFLGFVPEEEKKFCFSAADCFALPSEGEGQPITLLEAMKYGLPCYVTDILWVPEYLRDFAVEGDISSGIKKALDMDVDSEKVMTWDDIAEKTLEVYREAL